MRDTLLAVGVPLLCILSLAAQETSVRAAEARTDAEQDLAALAGQKADIAPSAYAYRSDRKPEENPPEAEFLFSALHHKKAGVLCGLLWEEPRPVERVDLCWPKGAEALPRPEDVEVRWLPHGDSSSWWSRRPAGKEPMAAATAAKPQVSPDGLTYSYVVDATLPARAMDNLVVALREGAAAEACPVPAVRAITPERWKRIEAEIEWGFDASRDQPATGYLLDVYNGILGKTSPLPPDSGRRGITLPILFLGGTINTSVWTQHARLEDANRTIVTVRAGSAGFSFLPADLETGPILAPESGFFIRALARPSAAPASHDAPAVRGLLEQRLDAVAGSPAVRGWGSNDTPWLGANPADKPASVSTFTLPPRSVAMHPSPTRPVAVAWRSPLQGKVSVKGKVADADPHGGNGIEFWLAHESKAGSLVLARGVVESGASGWADARGVVVEKGDLLLLAVSARDGNHGFDTTVVELAITSTGGEARTWDLTKDVAGNIQAGNPHADGFGNPAVWHFFAPEGAKPIPVVMPSQATSAREFQKELAGRGLKTIRQRVRDHAEQSWEGAMQALHPGGNWPPYPKPDFEPPAQIDVPDRRLTDAWRCGAWHLLRVLKKDAQGRYIMRDFPYDALAHETFLIIRALDLQGMHDAARDGLARWLERDDKPPIKIDGLFSDTVGALSGVEWDWQHAGGPGVMQWQMAEHYLLTGDAEWLRKAAPKLQASADWMIRQRHAYPPQPLSPSGGRGQGEGGAPAPAAAPPLSLPSPRRGEELGGRERLWCYGLLPPHNIWDSTNWRLWYETNANYCFGLRRYAEAIADLDPEASRKYLAEADAYAHDILAAVDKSFLLSPVIRVRDGTYRSFLPPTPYMRGPASRFIPTSFGSPEHTPGLYPDAIRGGVHLINLSGLLPPTDPRAQGLVDVLEDRLLLEHHRLPMRTRGYDPEKHWFAHAGWYYQCGIERTANVHLQWDDAPNFLRSFYNQYAVDIVVGPYTFNEHTTRGPADKSFEEAAFLERLRNLLVMEEGSTLWLARATPRAWLEQGKKIAVRNLPTHFGAVDYEIVSDADKGRISATVQMPSRRMPEQVLLRLRHPRAARLKGVRVNGKDWADFDPRAETIRLRGLKGPVSVEAVYAAAGPQE